MYLELYVRKQLEVNWKLFVQVSSQRERREEQGGAAALHGSLCTQDFAKDWNLQKTGVKAIKAPTLGQTVTESWGAGVTYESNA